MGSDCCVPLVPGLMDPRAPRMAWAAPRLMRRVKGETGMARGPLSSSSMAFSSIESEFVERLARRRSADGVVGEVPDKPMVVTESLRRCSFMVTDAMGVGKAVAGAWATELFLKRVEKAPEEREPRRCWRAISFGLVFELPLS